MKKSSEMNVRVARILKTSHKEAGIYPLDLPDGATVLVAGHAYWPDHDRSLHEQIILPALAALRPSVVVLAGGMIHDDAFVALAPRKHSEQNQATVIFGSCCKPGEQSRKAKGRGKREEGRVRGRG